MYSTSEMEGPTGVLTKQILDHFQKGENNIMQSLQSSVNINMINATAA